jgi:hypothetical protein
MSNRKRYDIFFTHYELSTEIWYQASTLMVLNHCVSKFVYCKVLPSVLNGFE